MTAKLTKNIFILGILILTTSVSTRAEEPTGCNKIIKKIGSLVSEGVETLNHLFAGLTPPSFHRSAGASAHEEMAQAMSGMFLEFIRGTPSLRSLEGEEFETGFEKLMVRHYREAAVVLARSPEKNPSLSQMARRSRNANMVSEVGSELQKRSESMHERVGTARPNELENLLIRIRLIKNAFEDYPQGEVKAPL